MRRAFAGTMLSFICSLMLITPAVAIDIRDLPEWIRHSIDPVYINWAEVYPGLVLDVSAVSVGGEELQTLQGVGSTGASTVSVGGEELQAVHGVGNAGEAQMGGVHGISVGDELKGVSLGQKGTPLVIPEPARTRGHALLLTWKGLMEQGKLDEESRRAWIAEHNVDRGTLIEALDSIPLSHPMDPIYIPICAALWDKMADDIEAYLEFPYAARIIMATYLGVLEREEDAKTLLSSLENPDKMSLGADLYHVACELRDYQECAYHLAIWAHKRGATMRGPVDQAFVCYHIMQECEKLGEPQVVREELIPWAEEALGRRGSETRWGYALEHLIWAYDQIGETQKAIERAQYWLKQAKERNVSPERLIRARRHLAQIYARTGRVHDAAEMLREAITNAAPDSWQAQRAETQLIELAREHSAVGRVELLPPHFEGVFPQTLDLSVRLGQEASRSISVVGNRAFKVTAADCTLAFAQTTLGEMSSWTDTKMQVGTSTQVVRLQLRPSQKLGKRQGCVRLETNDRGTPVVEVPVAVEVLAPITVRPDSFFFGFVKPGETKTATVRLTSTVPFEITAATADRPDVVTIRTSRQEKNSYLVKATIRASEQPGTLAGTTHLTTSLQSQSGIAIPYYAQIRETQ